MKKKTYRLSQQFNLNLWAHFKWFNSNPVGVWPLTIPLIWTNLFSVTTLIFGQNKIIILKLYIRFRHKWLSVFFYWQTPQMSLAHTVITIWTFTTNQNRIHHRSSQSERIQNEPSRFYWNVLKKWCFAWNKCGLAFDRF